MRRIAMHCSAGVQYDLIEYRSVIDKYANAIEYCNKNLIFCKQLSNKSRNSIENMRLQNAELIKEIRKMSMQAEAQLVNRDFRKGVQWDVQDILQREYVFNKGVRLTYYTESDLFVFIYETFT